MAWMDIPVFNPELERDLQAFQLRELERVNPKLARKLMFENSQLLFIRKEAALEALQRRRG